MKTLLAEFSNDQLGQLYKNTIGYNPFEENKGLITEHETRQDCIEILNEYSSLAKGNVIDFSGLLKPLDVKEDNSGIELLFSPDKGYQIFTLDTTENRWHVIYNAERNSFSVNWGATEFIGESMNECLTKLFTTTY